MNILKEDREQFEKWLALDINSIAWEGRNAESFHTFWLSLFKDTISYLELSERFDYARKIAKSGPLISWLTWIFDKFIVYTFIFNDISIRELALELDFEEKMIATILRDHFIKAYPVDEDFLNEKFQIANVSSENLFLRFSDIRPVLGDSGLETGHFEDDILANMEVTLYPDWNNLVSQLSKDLKFLKIDFDTVKKKTRFGHQLKFLQEVILLLLVLSFVVFALKNSNKWYEDYLVNKITLFESNFFWLDKSLSYQEQDALARQSLDLSNKELEELEKLEAQQAFVDESLEARFDPESDVVVLDSADAVPKFVDAENEQSLYEENRKGGYRDTSYGVTNRKAYRVLMASVDAAEIKSKILPLIEKYGISQVDNVRPGTEIPGGIYFNVHVPSKNLRDFLANVTSYSEATIFESRSQGGDRPGNNRVFIWIKKI